MISAVLAAMIVLSNSGIASSTQEDDHLMLLQMAAKAISNSEPVVKHNAFRSGLRSGASSIVRLLDFSKATVVANNLGGQGPKNGGKEEIRYRNLVVGQPVDLKIVADTGYSAYNSERNGILGANGQINAKSGTSVGLQFIFVDEGTDVPHVMPQFYMTFSDIDERHGGVEKEKILVDSFDQFYTNDDLQLEDPNYAANGRVPTFVSSDYGNYADNNLSPDSPNALLLSHSVTYLFTNKSSFRATFTVEQVGDSIKGRNIVFSGISQLVFCQEPSTFLHFDTAEVTVNNLGGMGPRYGQPEEIRYSTIATTKDGTDVDLVVTTKSANKKEDYGYKPANVSQNGLHGDFGIINLYCGPTREESEVDATFTIMKKGTNTPVELDAFAFAVFDFDTGLHEQQIEYVEARPTTPGFVNAGTGYASYIVTETTEVDVSDVCSSVTAAPVGGGCTAYTNEIVCPRTQCNWNSASNSCEDKLSLISDAGGDCTAFTNEIVCPRSQCQWNAESNKCEGATTCANYCSDEISSLKDEGIFEGPTDEICDPREGECNGCPSCKVTDQECGWKRFSATKHGTEADNPSTPQMLARESADKAVVFTFRKTSTFTLTFGITATGFNSGRNFMFSGQDMYTMCD